MLRYIKNAVKLRFNQLSFLRKLTNEEQLENILEVKTVDGLIYLKFLHSEKYSDYKEIVYVINNSGDTINYHFDDYHTVLFSDGVIIDDENIKVKTGLIGPASLIIVVKK
mgnify:CR=1 FL=1